MLLLAASVQLGIGSFVFVDKPFNYNNFFELIFYPIILVVVTFVLYRYILALNKEKEYLRESFTELELKSKELYQNYQNENEIRVNLEKRILKDDSFALKLQEHISSLASLNPQEIKAKLLEIVCEFINAKTASYYSFKNDTFYFEKGYGEDIFAYTDISSSDVIYQTFINSSDIISIKDNIQELSPNFIAAGVLRDAKRNILGLIVINKIDFLDINYTTMQLFKMLCNWASIALEKAEVYEIALQESIRFTGTHILNLDYFLDVFHREVKLSRRYKSYFSVIVFDIYSHNEILPDEEFTLITQIDKSLEGVLRDIDSVFINTITRMQFFIILQMTNESGALVVKQKIINNLNRQNIILHNQLLDYNISIVYIDANTTSEHVDEFLKVHVSNA